MSEDTDTGTITTNTGSIRTQDTAVRVFHTEDGVTATTVIPRGELRAYRHAGWTREDPAFTPDPDIVKRAQENDGHIAMHSNIGGLPKTVTADEVAWHQQNGWTVTPARAPQTD